MSSFPAAGARPEIDLRATRTDRDWASAARLPADLFAAAWREPDRWRRLHDERTAGQRFLELSQLLTRDAAEGILDEVSGLSWSRLSTDLVRADRHLLGPAEVPTWLDLLQGEAFRGLVSAVLGREMPPGLVVNAWRLRRHDHMGAHPDGPLYHGTISLGLCREWSVADGGAIAFGIPHDDGLDVRQRWFPHLGDACLFAPEADTWHLVEPVAGRRMRYSLTGWWVTPADGLTRGGSPAP